MSRRFARSGLFSGFVRQGGATLTASATPHTDGAYTQLLAAAAQDIFMMRMTTALDVSQSTIDTSMLVSIAVGAAASEVDVISNVPQGGSQGQTVGTNYHLWFPLHIPAGSRVAGKLRAEQVSDTYTAQVEFWYGGRIPGWGGYAIAETLGADTANSRGTVISNTAGTWTTVSASTPNPIRAFMIAVALVDNTAATTSHTVDVGVGAAASEVIIGTWTVQTGVQETVFNFVGPPFIERPIPAGSRIAVKKSTTDDLSVAVIGYR